MTHPELLEAIADNQELCGRALSQLQTEASAPSASSVSIADLDFLDSWMKAQNLVLGGMQLLQLADPENASSVQHEIECTETAFKLLPDLILEARKQKS